jgi:hypothetical protein
MPALALGKPSVVEYSVVFLGVFLLLRHEAQSLGGSHEANHLIL